MIATPTSGVSLMACMIHRLPTIQTHWRHPAIDSSCSTLATAAILPHWNHANSACSSIQVYDQHNHTLGESNKAFAIFSMPRVVLRGTRRLCSLPASAPSLPRLSELSHAAQQNRNLALNNPRVLEQVISDTYLHVKSQPLGSSIEANAVIPVLKLCRTAVLHSPLPYRIQCLAAALAGEVDRHFERQWKNSRPGFSLQARRIALDVVAAFIVSSANSAPVYRSSAVHSPLRRLSPQTSSNDSPRALAVLPSSAPPVPFNALCQAWGVGRDQSDVRASELVLTSLLGADALPVRCVSEAVAALAKARKVIPSCRVMGAAAATAAAARGRTAAAPSRIAAVGHAVLPPATHPPSNSSASLGTTVGGDARAHDAAATVGASENSLTLAAASVPLRGLFSIPLPRPSVPTSPTRESVVHSSSSSLSRSDDDTLVVLPSWLAGEDHGCTPPALVGAAGAAVRRGGHALCALLANSAEVGGLCSLLDSGADTADETDGIGEDRRGGAAMGAVGERGLEGCWSDVERAANGGVLRTLPRGERGGGASGEVGVGVGVGVGAAARAEGDDAAATPAPGRRKGGAPLPAPSFMPAQCTPGSYTRSHTTPSSPTIIRSALTSATPSTPASTTSKEVVVNPFLTPRRAHAARNRSPSRATSTFPVPLPTPLSAASAPSTPLSPASSSPSASSPPPHREVDADAIFPTKRSPFSPLPSRRPPSAFGSGSSTVYNPASLNRHSTPFDTRAPTSSLSRLHVRSATCIQAVHEVAEAVDRLGTLFLTDPSLPHGVPCTESLPPIPNVALRCLFAFTDAVSEAVGSLPLSTTPVVPHPRSTAAPSDVVDVVKVSRTPHPFAPLVATHLSLDASAVAHCVAVVARALSTFALLASQQWQLESLKNSYATRHGGRGGDDRAVDGASSCGEAASEAVSMSCAVEVEGGTASVGRSDDDFSSLYEGAALKAVDGVRILGGALQLLTTSKRGRLLSTASPDGKEPLTQPGNSTPSTPHFVHSSAVGIPLVECAAAAAACGHVELAATLAVRALPSASSFTPRRLRDLIVVFAMAHTPLMQSVRTRTPSAPPPRSSTPFTPPSVPTAELTVAGAVVRAVLSRVSEATAHHTVDVAELASCTAAIAVWMRSVTPAYVAIPHTSPDPAARTSTNKRAARRGVGGERARGVSSETTERAFADIDDATARDVGQLITRTAALVRRAEAAVANDAKWHVAASIPTKAAGSVFVGGSARYYPESGGAGGGGVEGFGAAVRGGVRQTSSPMCGRGVKSVAQAEGWSFEASAVSSLRELGHSSSVSTSGTHVGFDVREGHDEGRGTAESLTRCTEESMILCTDSGSGDVLPSSEVLTGRTAPTVSLAVSRVFLGSVGLLGDVERAAGVCKGAWGWGRLQPPVLVGGGGGAARSAVEAGDMKDGSSNDTMFSFGGDFDSEGWGAAFNQGDSDASVKDDSESDARTGGVAEQDSGARFDDAVSGSPEGGDLGGAGGGPLPHLRSQPLWVSPYITPPTAAFLIACASIGHNVAPLAAVEGLAVPCVVGVGGGDDDTSFATSSSPSLPPRRTPRRVTRGKKSHTKAEVSGDVARAGGGGVAALCDRVSPWVGGSKAEEGADSSQLQHGEHGKPLHMVVAPHRTADPFIRATAVHLLSKGERVVVLRPERMLRSRLLSSTSLSDLEQAIESTLAPVV